MRKQNNQQFLPRPLGRGILVGGVVNELASEAIEAVSVKIPDNTRWWMPEHYDQEFARLIIQEVAKASVAKAAVPKADIPSKTE